MKVTIDIPQKFEQHFNKDRFEDSLKRIITDVTDEIESDFSISGKYEIELCEMLIEALKNAEYEDAEKRNEADGTLPTVYCDGHLIR